MESIFLNAIFNDSLNREDIGISKAVDLTNIATFIEDYFNTHMKNSNIPLFADFSSYSKSLPVRFYKPDNKIPRYLSLYKLDYYVRPNDLTDMAKSIIQSTYARAIVRYICAPSASGKTASVLPAFLRSTTIKGGGTHYIYMAFHNNNKRNFRVSPYTPSSDEIIAEQQGAAFIVECVKVLLEDPDNTTRYTITLEASPELEVESCSEILSEYLTRKLGEEFMIYFHLDGHVKMCNQEDGKGATFTRGAMEALACAQGVTVISTSNKPPSLPAVSSGICRTPIPLPSIDIKQVMLRVPELSIVSSNFDNYQRQLLASPKLRFGFQFKEMDLISLLHVRQSKSKTEHFLRDFADRKKNIQIDATETLEKLNRDFKYESLRGVSILPDDTATQLLLCVKDGQNLGNRGQQLSEMVSLSKGFITVSVHKLLSVFDPKIKVYAMGRQLFHEQLLLSPELLSGSTLQTAYFWTLACRSALCQSLDFSHMYNINYRIKCNNLIPGRLFPGTDSTEYNLDFLKPGVMYYADERVRGGRSQPTHHPLANLFFITDENELVLVDIYSGMSKNELIEKRNALTAWLNSEQTNILQYTLRGVILAPNVNIESKTVDNVLSVTGEEAVLFLGGLKQIIHWLE